MAFTYELNKLMLIDGILFILPGISFILMPSPQARLKDKMEQKSAIAPFKGVTMALGAAYISMGLIIAALAGIISEKAELNNFAKFRAISLLFIVYAISMQMAKKKWKWSGYRLMYLVLYSLLILVYAFIGFIDPMPIY